MMKYYISFLLIMTLFSCQKEKKESSIHTSDLERIELSLSSMIEDRLMDIEIENAINEAKWHSTYQKIRSFDTLNDSIFRIIHNKKISDSEVKNIINRFKHGVDRLNLSDEKNMLLRNQRFDNWLNSSYFEEQSNALAIDLRLCILDILDELVNQIDISATDINYTTKLNILIPPF